MNRSSILGLVVTAAVSAVVGGAVVYLARAPEPPVVLPPPPPPTAPEVARPAAVPDEVSRLTSELFSRGRKLGTLVSFEVENVDATGTLDLQKGSLSAIFRREAAPAETGGGPTGTECLRIRYANLAWTEERTPAELCKLFSDPDDVLFEPRCSMRSLWALAKERNRAPDGLAHLRYESDGGWFFYLHGDPPFGAALPDACR